MKTTIEKGIFVELQDSPESVGEATEALGEDGINILGFQVDRDGPGTVARFITDEPDRAVQSLEGIGVTPQTRDVVLAPARNEPGELGQISSALGRSGVQIASSFPVLDPEGQEPRIAFDVDDAASARKALEG